MLTLCHGPDLTELADHLMETLRNDPPANPLAPERIVVNNYGMQKWLTTYGAEKEGIVANWKFYFVAEKMWDLIRLMDSDIPEDLPSEREPMTWSLMHLLEEHRGDAQLKLLHYYIRDEDPEVQAFRSWKLCSNIAGVFDQYMLYRPDMILQWERGKLVTNNNDEPWQARLWQLLVQHWKNTAGDPKWLHRAQINAQLIKEIDKGGLNQGQLPDRIVIFGVPTMQPVYIRTLVKLSKLIDVCVYLLDDVYFHEDNPLIASLGQEGRDYKYYFEMYAGEDAGVRFQEKSYSYKENSPTGNSLLDYIRRDLVQPESKQPEGAKADRSVQVHSCHSPMREVEVLYDQLLDLLEKDRSLTPADILIMAPDMNIYAPVIDAVFGTPEEEAKKITYSIYDRGGAICGPLTSAFIELMKLLGSRFKVTQVIDFLGLEPVQDAFGFTDEQLNTLERWIKENRIRWGIDGAFKSSLSLPETKGFTWVAGLDRMVLGYAMKQEGDRLFDGIYPYGEIENTDDAELLGSFSKLMRSLFHFYELINRSRSPQEWSRLLRELADGFMPDTEVWFWELSQLREHIDQLSVHADLAGFDSVMPFRIIRSHLEQKLREQQQNNGLMARGITFSSTAPMRSIPFKVIGMIGMNDGAFPSLEVPVEFDLMNKYPRRGDRSRRNGDRHLFLENILSAGKAVYFSYLGQSNREDIEFPPSVVLQEFLDYIETRFGIKAEELTVRHRLQAFSSWYFNKESHEKKLFSYSAYQEEIASILASPRHTAEAFLSGGIPGPEGDWKKVSIQELIRFYQHPSRYLLRNRLGIYLEEEEAIAGDREPFYLDGLEGYQLGQELLNRYLKGIDPGSFKEVARSVNLLPQGWPGEEAFQNKLEEVVQFGKSLEQMLDHEPLEPVEADIQSGEYRLTGRLDNLFSSGLILYRFGSMRAKDLIELWIKHLVLQVAGPDDCGGYSRLFTKDGKKPFALYELSPMQPDEARTLLGSLLDDYQYGLSNPFFFFPNSSFTYANEVVHKGKVREQGLKSAGYQWKDSYRGYPREGDDPYNHRVFGGGNPLESEEFTERAVSFWNPFFEVLNREQP